MNFKTFCCLSLIGLMTGCANVNVRTDNMPEVNTAPTFEESYSFWWWGIEGEYEVNVREVCLGKGVEQMQTVATFNDALITLATLGIYSKRSARVWCKD